LASSQGRHALLRFSRHELHRSESQFKTLVGGVTDYALYMLDPSGIVSNWNAGGQRIKGYAADEIVGQHFSKFYTPNDRANDKPAKALRTALETGHYEEEGQRVRKDGTFFWASVVIDPIRNDAGELIGFAKITRDISERKQAEERLAQIQKQLAESQKLDALGQLTGGVAHDFNNLLMIIAGNLHTLRKEVTTEKSLRAVQSIDTASQRAAALTRQLLTFARRQSVRPQPIALAERLILMKDMLNSGLGSSVSMAIDAAPDVGTIEVDASEFETALVNLVINARDAMPEGGTVVVGAKNKGDFIEVSVEDSGVGIPPDILDKVFDPFFTTKPVGKGTGLGLSQVHGFSHQAGGTIRIESQMGEGTTITMSLPRSRATESDSTLDPTTSSGMGTILLVRTTRKSPKRRPA
jgi:PAS domain S-box-containing protein